MAWAFLGLTIHLNFSSFPNYFLNLVSSFLGSRSPKSRIPSSLLLLPVSRTEAATAQLWRLPQQPHAPHCCLNTNPLQRKLTHHRLTKLKLNRPPVLCPPHHPHNATVTAPNSSGSSNKDQKERSVENFKRTSPSSSFYCQSSVSSFNDILDMNTRFTEQSFIVCSRGY